MASFSVAVEQGSFLPAHMGNKKIVASAGRASFPHPLRFFPTRWTGQT